MGSISIRGLSKSYGSKTVLDGIDLDVAPHEVVALIGPSGSGKSTLLRCINQLVDPDGGTVLIDGMPVDDDSFGRTGLYKRIGIVFQSYNLFPHINVIDNVTLAPRKVHGQDKATAEAKAMELLTAFGLGEFAGAYPEQLSGGQQQRTAIVRALATEPDVLLLDEVTASLDPELVGEVLLLIRQLKAKGLTMIVVTHEMPFARDVADRVCFLDGGRIVEQAPAHELFANPQQPRTQRFLQRIIEAGRLGG
jgi:polar amino acid transport system ATP-binding protein